MANDVNELKFSAWYRRAWSGFSRWWIPLCAVAFIFVAVQLTPQVLIQNDPRATSLSKEVRLLVSAAQKRDERQVQNHMRRVQARTRALMLRFVELMIWIGPIALAVGVLLIILGMGASSDEGIDLKRDSARTGRRGLFVVLTQAIATVGVLTPVAFFLLLPRLLALVIDFEPSGLVIATLVCGLLAILSVPLCMALYLFFFFAPQLAADESLNPFKAMVRSARLVRLAIGPVALLVFCNGTLQGLSSLTVIGLVPVTAFANTARGAAYYALLKEEKRRAGEAVSVTVNPVQASTAEPAPQDKEDGPASADQEK